MHLAWTEGFWPGMETQQPPGGVGGAFINHTCAFSTSRDHGATWDQPHLHRYPGMIGGNPVLAVGGGRAYRVCMGVADTRETFFKSGILELSASSDAGATWGPWHIVASQNSSNLGCRQNSYVCEVDKPWVLVDGASVYISFTRFPTTPYVASGEGTLEVISSHDGGASFAASVVLGPGQGSFLTQATAGGALYASYVHNGVAQIATSLDRGATFKIVPGPSLPGVGFPTLTYLHAQVDGGMAFLAGSAHYFGPARLFSRPADGAWSTGTQLAASALNAGMSVSTNGTVDLVWTECTPLSGGRPGTGPGNPGYGPALNGTAQTFAASSTDGGMAFQKRTAVSDLYPAHCGYPDVPGDLAHGYTVYKGAYQGLVRDGLGRLQLFYIKWGPSKLLDRPWGSTLWRAVLQGSPSPPPSPAPSPPRCYAAGQCLPAGADKKDGKTLCCNKEHANHDEKACGKKGVVCK